MKTNEEYVKRNAFFVFAGYYAEGRMGMPQNWAKANELYLKAGAREQMVHPTCNFLVL